MYKKRMSKLISNHLYSLWFARVYTLHQACLRRTPRMFANEQCSYFCRPWQLTLYRRCSASMWKAKCIYSSTLVKWLYLQHASVWMLEWVGVGAWAACQRLSDSTPHPLVQLCLQLMAHTESINTVMLLVWQFQSMRAFEIFRDLFPGRHLTINDLFMWLVNAWLWVFSYPKPEPRSGPTFIISLSWTVFWQTHHMPQISRYLPVLDTRLVYESKVSVGSGQNVLSPQLLLFTVLTDEMNEHMTDTKPQQAIIIVLWPNNHYTINNFTCTV